MPFSRASGRKKKSTGSSSRNSKQKKLKPSPAADKATLIERASLDLTGLRPTYEEVQAFVADKSPDAYEKLIDRLLASRHYGERWGRYWLDVARYGEDNPDFRSHQSRRIRSPGAIAIG